MISAKASSLAENHYEAGFGKCHFNSAGVEKKQAQRLRKFGRVLQNNKTSTTITPHPIADLNCLVARQKPTKG